MTLPTSVVGGCASAAFREFLPHPMYADPRNDMCSALAIGAVFGTELLPQLEITFFFSDGLRVPNLIPTKFLTLAGRFPYAVCVRYGARILTVYQLVEEQRYTWVRGEQIGLFVTTYETTVKSAPVLFQEVVPDLPMVASLFLTYALKGPRSEDLRFSLSVPFEGGEEYMSEGRDYHVKEDAYGGGDEFVPSYIRQQVFTTLFLAGWKEPRYQEPSYYHSSYGIWTLANHQDQWRAVVASLSPDTVIVAPGDGVGVLSGMWGGKIVAGDISIPSSALSSVHQESIIDTLNRARDTEGTKVLVLSYISSFITEAEWELIEQESWPVFILDFRPIIRPGMGPLALCGPGLVVYRRDPVVSHAREFRHVRAQKVLYTENLLNEDSLVILSLNHFTDYLFTVAPRKQYYCPDPNLCAYMTMIGVRVTQGFPPQATVLTVTLAELLKYISVQPYFAPIGLRVGSITQGVGDEFSVRKVYSVFSSPLNRARLAHVPTYSGAEGLLFFYWPEDSEFLAPVDYATSTSLYHGQIRFVTTASKFLPYVTMTGGELCFYYAPRESFLTTLSTLEGDLLKRPFHQVPSSLVNLIISTYPYDFPKIFEWTSSLDSWIGAGGIHGYVSPCERRVKKLRGRKKWK